jgi:hypothetical protein
MGTGALSLGAKWHVEKKNPIKLIFNWCLLPIFEILLSIV